MPIFQIVLVLLISYLLGSIPFGLVVVRIFTGKDVRTIESGRTGGTNAMRAAGYPVGLLTTCLDIFKGASTMWLVNWLAAGYAWVRVAAAVLVVIGHNYSIYLIERKEDGRLRLRGGAGGTPALGGAIALWPMSALIIIPIAVSVFAFVGYASLATISIGLTALIIFIIRASMGLSPWVYVLYAVITEGLILWALRPNLKRLAAGTERVVGFRAARKKRNPPPGRTEDDNGSCDG